MSARQRLRAVLNARKSSGICWRCSRGLPRRISGLGQLELDNQGEGSFDEGLFFSTRRDYGLPGRAQPVQGLTPDKQRPFKSWKRVHLPVQGARDAKEETFPTGPRITYHNVTPTPDNAPQFLPPSMVDPRIHFHKVDKKVNARRKLHPSLTDRDHLEQLKSDMVGTRSREHFRHLDRATAEGKQDSSQRFKQIQTQVTSTNLAEHGSLGEGHVASAPKPFRIIRYPIHSHDKVNIKKVPFLQVHKSRVGNTERFVSITQSADANYPVRWNISFEDEAHQTPETEEALHGDLESVLNAFRDLPLSELSPSDAPNLPASSAGSEAKAIAFEQGDARDQGNAGLWSNRQHSRGNPIPTTMIQTRHYTTAIHPSPTTSRDDPLTVDTTPIFDTASSTGIREHLRLWQEQQNKDVEQNIITNVSPRNLSTASQNILNQSGEDDSFTKLTEDSEMDEEQHIDLHLEKDEVTTDIFQNRAFLRKGDLVELTAKTEPILAIFVKGLINQCQFYTMRGEWVNRELSIVKFAVSGFVHPDELNDILPYLPADEVAIEKLDRLQPMDVNAPRDAGRKVLEKMSAFNQAADSVFRNHADRLNRAYELIAPWHERAGRTFKSLKKIAMSVLQRDSAELTQPMMWAVHRALMASQNITFDQMNFRQNPVYEIIPQQSLRSIALVREWVREYQEDLLDQVSAALKSTLDPKSQNPIANFIKKARIAIERSRSTRPLSVDGGIGPSSVKIKPVEPQFRTYMEFASSHYSDNERLIIQYLDAWVTSQYINKTSNLKSLGPMILRAVGKYDDLELTESIGYTFLQELGVVTPWENRTIYKLRGLRLPGHDTVSEETTRLRSNARASLTTFEPLDSMESLRKDWGDMPVFCIDGAETLERDDGVSLEPINGKPSEYWVHVHVANPSAYIGPRSPSAQYAAQLAESVYFPECKYPMLDPSLTSNHFSLDKDRACLTFSARMTTAGEILEKKITPGRVHNVHCLTHHAVGYGLGLNVLEEPETVSLLSVGGEIPTRPKDLNPKTGETLIASHVGMLRTLADLGKAVRLRRAPDYYQSGSSTTTYPQVFLRKTVPRPFHLWMENIRRFEGDPIISIQQETSNHGLVGLMVADLMILAGDIAASWCSERNIPIPYRGLLRNPEPPIAPEYFKRDVIDRSMALKGHVDSSELLRYGKLLGSTAISATPLEHFALGLPAYCKATSPLRRYVDLYTHWQIEAALRHEANTGENLIGTNKQNDSFLPFSRQAVEDYASTAIYSQRKIAYAKKAATHHWIVQALHRAFYFGEATLPKTFKISVTGTANGCEHGFMRWLNVKVRLPQSPESTREGGWRPGDVWEARIGRVEPYTVSILMVAVKLLERGGKECAVMDEGIQA